MTDLDTARDDLAYLKGLVDGQGARTRVSGLLFIAGGLIYAAQCLGHWADWVGIVSIKGPAGLLLAFGPTVVFLGILGWVMWNDRHKPKGGMAVRAINTVFAATGSTNFVMIVVFATVSIRQQNFLIWFLYPCTVCALQGAAWLAAGSLSKRPWQIAVAIGWFAVTIGMAFTLGQPTYLLLISAGLLFLMALPGLILVRQAAKEG